MKTSEGGGGGNEKVLKHTNIWPQLAFLKSVRVRLAEKKRLEPARIVSGLRVKVRRSRLNLLRDDGEDDVLVAPPHHSPQRLVPLDGGAHVTGRSDWVAVNADDDITFPEAGSVATEITEEGEKAKEMSSLKRKSIS